MVLYAGFFCLLVLSECDYDPYAGAVPVEDAVVDGLEDMGKAEVAARLCRKPVTSSGYGVAESLRSSETPVSARLCNSLPPVSDESMTW